MKNSPKSSSINNEIAKLAAIVASSNDAIISKNLDGNITSWNKAAEKLFGYKAKEIIGKPIKTIIPKELYKEEDKIIATLRKGQQIEHFETIRVKKNGTRFHVSVSISPIKNEKGVIIGAAKIARDITEKIEMQEALQNQKEELEVILKNISDGITIQNTQGNLLYANESAAKMVGYTSAKKLLETPITQLVEKFDLMDESGKEFPVQNLPGRKAMRGIKQKPILLRFRIRKTAEEYWSVVRAVPIFDSQKNLRYVINVFHDITQFKKSEESSKAAHQRTVNILESISDAFYAVDKEWRFTYINKKAEQLWGRKRQGLLGKKIWEVFPEAIGSMSYEKQTQAMKDHKPVRIEAVSPVLHGWIEVSIYPGNDGLSVFFQDISERKKIEQRKDDFIALASHELKTPVTSLKMFTQLLRKLLQKKGEEQLVKHVSTMDSQITKLTDIVNGLLDVSRVQKGKMEYKKQAFEVRQLVKETIESIRGIHKTHTIKMGYLTKRRVVADRDRVGQVLLNLINNAIKYSPSSKEVIVNSHVSKKFVTVSVKDFGIGIPKKDQKKIFGRFFQVGTVKPQTFPGLGLGLYISKEIIEQHKGKIWLESEEGKGSTFYFSLPCTA